MRVHRRGHRWWETERATGEFVLEFRAADFVIPSRDYHPLFEAVPPWQWIAAVMSLRLPFGKLGPITP